MTYHPNVVEALKVAVARLTVVVRLDLVLSAGFLGGPRLVAKGTLPCEMVLCSHVLPARTLTCED